MLSVAALASLCWHVETTRFRNIRSVNGYPRVFAVTKLRAIPHEGEPFTQGLEMSLDNKLLVETSGAFPSGTSSYVRMVDAQTGKTVKRTEEGLKAPAFIEGITKHDGHWFASTYIEKRALEYDADMKLVKEHPYPFEGWGLTRAADALLATNGSEHLSSFEAGSFKLLGSKTLTCMGRPIAQVNELEYVPDFEGQGPTVLGNLYTTRLVIGFDPDTAVCTSIFDLSNVGEAVATDEHAGNHVANGIAYNSSSGNFWVTGKNWKEMFEISIEEANEETTLKKLQEALAPGGAAR